MPHIVKPEMTRRAPKDLMPGLINTTTMTGEQRTMIDGIIHETRPSHKVAPPPGMVAPGEGVPLMKVKSTATKYNLGMTHIRGTRY